MKAAPTSHVLVVLDSFRLAMGMRVGLTFLPTIHLALLICNDDVVDQLTSNLHAQGSSAFTSAHPATHPHGLPTLARVASQRQNVPIWD